MYIAYRKWIINLKEREITVYEHLCISGDSVPLTHSILSLHVISRSELHVDCIVVEGPPDLSLKV